MVTNSHYDVEDIPGSGTAIDLYEQARQAVDDVPVKAQALIEQAGLLLGELYNAATERGDDNALMAINAIWDRSQGLVNHLVQQHQVIAGADVAIDELKQQREAIAEELNELVTAIHNMDTDHPKLADFTQAIEEWSSDMLWESYYDTAADSMHMEFSATLAPMIREIDPRANVAKRVEWFIEILKGEVVPTTEQRELLIDLLRTMGN